VDLYSTQQNLKPTSLRLKTLDEQQPELEIKSKQQQWVEEKLKELEHSNSTLIQEVDKLTALLYDRDASMESLKHDLHKAGLEVTRLQSLIVQYEIRETEVRALETEREGLRVQLARAEAEARREAKERAEEREMAAEVEVKRGELELKVGEMRQRME
jgi:hypothetical protein